jgi:hypothetical protein
MDAPAVIAAAHAALRAIEPGAVPLHDDIVFLPSAPEPEPEPESAAEASDGEAKLDWADDFEAQIASEDDALEFRAADASPSDVSAESHPPAERALSFAEIDALSVEEKLALFC